MDQLIFASLFLTHYWYAVGTVKVPATIFTGEDCMVGRAFCTTCRSRNGVRELASDMFNTAQAVLKDNGYRLVGDLKAVN